MTDTLRSIAEGMEHRTVSGCSIPQWSELVARGLTHFDHDENCCPKCRLEAVLGEYEKVDLVKRWRFHEDGVCEHVRLTGCDDKRSCHEVDADELETWLAVNLERIKSEHYADGFDAGASALEAQAKGKP